MDLFILKRLVREWSVMLQNESKEGQTHIDSGSRHIGQESKSLRTGRKNQSKGSKLC